jgi:hypothetical protein
VRARARADELRQYAGDDAAAFVVSLNLHRRHLTESQRGMVAARLANMTEGGDRVSDQSANLHSGAVSRSDAAEKLSVSPRTVATAAKVQAEATPEVVRAVEAGAVSLNLAAQVVALPPETQAAASEAIAAAPGQRPADRISRGRFTFFVDG